MKKVLVLGAGGAMGQYLVPQLDKLGYEIYAVDLKENESDKKNIKWIQANVFEEGVLDELMKGGYDSVVDFMTYGADNFHEFAPKFLDNTDQYFYLSSCRVYANEEIPVKETSPRILDVSKDEVLLNSRDYCIYKAKGENWLKESKYKNWTIVRPATTYSYMRYQLVTTEAALNVGRAKEGKKVVLPIQAIDKPATLSWGGDVAEMISKLVFNEEALANDYIVSTSEHRTWKEIAEYYKDICGLEVVWVDKEDYLWALNPEKPLRVRYQLEVARLYDRITDNSKILKATGMKQENLMPLYDGLKMEIEKLPKDFMWQGPVREAIGQRMDEIIARL